ncbi:MAG: hypothetical protein ACKOB4_03530 [Acidobacteriota bacterium]
MEQGSEGDTLHFNHLIVRGVVWGRPVRIPDAVLFQPKSRQLIDGQVS